MCTLVLIHRVVADAPLIVLANRDEFLNRPTRPPHFHSRHPAIVSGIDERQGGTWCGVNDRGLFVGVTNWTLRLPDPLRRSRGLLCLDMLRLEHARAVERASKELAGDGYNPFNLVAADGLHGVRVSFCDGPSVERLAPGVHVTTNWPRESKGDQKRLRTEELVRAAVDTASDTHGLLDALAEIGKRHEGDGDPRLSVCCHAEGYGTRSSSIIAMGPECRTLSYLHADGPPCTTEYEALEKDVSRLLEESGRRSEDLTR